MFAIIFESKKQAERALAFAAEYSSHHKNTEDIELKVRYSEDDKERRIVQIEDDEIFEMNESSGGEVDWERGPVFYYGKPSGLK